MNYYEHHIGDYAEATAHLTFVEDAAYSRMIRKYYATERPLPADVKQVQRLVGARTKEEREAVESVLQEFFTLQADGWHQARCDADLQRYIAKQEKARASANARWSKPQDERNANASQPYMQTDSERNANASGSHDGRNALQSPVPSNQTPDTKKDRKPARAPAFEPPDWINRQHWDVWHSTAKRKKATPEQRQMAVDKLAEWRAAGLDYATALENAAIGGNQGLFLPSSPQGRQSAQARTINALTGGLASPKDSHALTLA